MKDNKLEDGISRFSSFSERGYAAIIANSGKIVAAVAATVAALVTFADISFLEIGSAAFTSSLLVLLISSYLIYFSLEDAGERLGKESAEYLCAMKKYDEIRAKIKPDDTSALREYTDRYSKEELEYRIKSHLCRHGCSYEEFHAFLKRGVADKQTKKYLRQASKMKASSLTASELLSVSGGTRGELKHPRGEKAFTAVSKLLPSTVCMIFTASVILTAKSDLSASVIIESLLKL